MQLAPFSGGVSASALGDRTAGAAATAGESFAASAAFTFFRRSFRPSLSGFAGFAFGDEEALTVGDASSKRSNVFPDLRDLYAESGQTLQGSFSAVSKPNFAIKYSLESSRRDLHKALLCTVL